MLNRVILIGRLTRDPEVRYTSSNIPVANFTLAVDRSRKNAQGERETDFIDIVLWQKSAELAKQYLTKGRLIAVDGRLQVRTWQTKEGDNRKTYEVVGDSFNFLDKGDRQAPAAARNGGEAAPPHEDAPPPAPSGRGEGFDEEDDLPF